MEAPIRPTKLFLVSKTSLCYTNQRVKENLQPLTGPCNLFRNRYRFTDANVMINKEGIVAIARHYANEKIGGVSGEKVVMHDERAAAASTEGVYWKYESF